MMLEASHGIDILRLTLRSREIDKHFSSKLGLTVDEMHCLSLIYSEKPACVKDLCMQLEMNATRLSKVLWSLERKGYVERSIDELDHRKEHVHPTEVGRTLARQIIAHYASIARKVFGNWPEEVVSDFVRLYRTVRYDE